MDISVCTPVVLALFFIGTNVFNTLVSVWLSHRLTVSRERQKAQVDISDRDARLAARDTELTALLAENATLKARLAERDPLREASAPLLKELADLAGKLDLHRAGGGNAPGGMLLDHDIALTQACAGMQPILDDAHGQALRTAVNACIDEQVYHNAEEAQRRVRSAQKLVHELLGH